MRNSTFTNSTSDRPEVLTTATIRAATALGLTHRQLCATLGLSSPTVSGMRSGARRLQPDTRQWERAVLLVRLLEGVDRVLASDEQAIRAWMVHHNLELGGRPVDMIAEHSGFPQVVAYVESYNSRV